MVWGGGEGATVVGGVEDPVATVADEKTCCFDVEVGSDTAGVVVEAELSSGSAAMERQNDISSSSLSWLPILACGQGTLQEVY